MSRYATTTDLTRLGLPSTALANVSPTTQEDSLDAMSAIADGYLSSRYELPLSVWGDDLRACVCRLAAYDLMVTRGYNPTAGADENLLLRHDHAMRWLRDVASGAVSPAGIVDATPADTTDNETTFAVTSSSRGWRR